MHLFHSHWIPLQLHCVDLVLWKVIFLLYLVWKEAAEDLWMSCYYFMDVSKHFHLVSISLICSLFLFLFPSVFLTPDQAVFRNICLAETNISHSDSGYNPFLFKGEKKLDAFHVKKQFQRWERHVSKCFIVRISLLLASLSASYHTWKKHPVWWFKPQERWWVCTNKM